MGWLRRHYGAGPLHLLTLVTCFALAGYAMTRVWARGGFIRIAVWFVVAALAHDLVLWPMYALADRSAVRLAHRHPERLPRVPWVNHVRIPAIMSAMLLGISFPLVLRLSATNYHDYTGLTESPYLGHWLLVTGLLFGASALVYALRLGRATTSRRRVSGQ